MHKHGEILDAVFDCCPSEWYDRRVAGRCPNGRIRATTRRPCDALDSLRHRLSDHDLLAAGVVKRNAFGELRIVPELCQPGGTVMALRRNPTEPPFDLLTGRGSVTGEKHAVIAALEDFRKATLVDETGVMLAAHRIKGAAVLDFLGLPVTPAFGLSGLSLSDCREIDARYREGLPRFSVLDPELDQKATKTTDGENDEEWQTPSSDQSQAFRPMLVLVDRLRSGPQDTPLLWLKNTAG